MVTPAGTVKVLDFGLAAVTQPSAVEQRRSQQLADADHGGDAGRMILGTAGYMAPEQAAGQAVDKRADIWAFGVVLFEMLTGQRLFTGDSIAHILADVLRAPIDFDKLPEATPRAIRDLLKRCLDRDAKTRLRDIGEARIAIQNVGKQPETTVSAPGTMWLTGRLPWVAAAVLADPRGDRSVGTVAFANPADRPLMRLDVDLGADVSLPVTPSGGDQHCYLARWNAAGVRVTAAQQDYSLGGWINRKRLNSREHKGRSERSSRRTGNGLDFTPMASSIRSW